MTTSALVPALSLRTRLAILLRLFAVQGAFNYETMLGNGIAFALEPALRLLPGGRGGPAYRAALARNAGYFNAHPYLAAMAVGALARAELAGEAPDRIERFRTACCGPLGSVGDQLVWAAWLPACSLLALLAFGLGASPAAVVGLFLGTYNAGHVALRLWALHHGFRDGLLVAASLGSPLMRYGLLWSARLAALLAGVALPLAARTLLGAGGRRLAAALIVAALGGVALAQLHGRVEGWRLAVPVVAALVFAAVAR